MMSGILMNERTPNKAAALLVWIFVVFPVLMILTLQGSLTLNWPQVLTGFFFALLLVMVGCASWGFWTGRL
jgi:hypothetical protein